MSSTPPQPPVITDTPDHITLTDRGQAAPALQPNTLPTPAKLAVAWASFMFLYIYVDYLSLYKPGFIDDILAGVVFEFDINQTFVVSSLTLISIPTFMILLSAVLPARANRITNLVVAVLYIPISAFNAVGEAWLLYYGLGVVLELILLGFILRTAWTWPRSRS